MHPGEEIDKSLTPGDGARLLLCVDQQQVTCPHAQVHHNPVGIGEIYITHHDERLFIIGIESVVLEQQSTVYHTHRVAVKTHTHAVGNAGKVGGVDEYLAVNLRMNSCSLDGETALAIAFEAYDLVGNETVGK